MESSRPQRFVTLSNVGEVGEATVNIEYKDGSETRGRAESCILPAQRSMSERAGSTVEEAAGSHSMYVSQPAAVADLIEKAASDVRSAAR